MSKVIQHPPIRVPQGWKGQDSALVMQIDRLFDDVYRELTLLKEKIKELEEAQEE
jgi:hypothetical protein